MQYEVLTSSVTSGYANRSNCSTKCSVDIGGADVKLPLNSLAHAIL